MPASGDLIVMGGRCQADWLHAVPKVAGSCGSRISVQWRWTSRRGRPDTDPGFYDGASIQSVARRRLGSTRGGSPGIFG